MNTALWTQDGMDLRDYLAAKAMQALLADYMPNRRIPGTDKYEENIIAKQAYTIADAMLAERNK